MTTHTIKGHVYWQQNEYMKSPRIVFDQYDMRKWPEQSRDGRVWISEHSFEVEVPDDFDPRPQMVESLRAEKDRIRAEFAAKVAELDGRINSLLALEMA